MGCNPYRAAMSTDLIPPILLGVVFGLIVSCPIAAACGGSALWGILGPLGWLLSAIQGVQRRLDSINDALRPGYDPARGGGERRPGSAGVAPTDPTATR